jgi:hypothetical protein
MSIMNQKYKLEQMNSRLAVGTDLNLNRVDLGVRSQASTDPATGIGYATGAGGAVTQATSKVTGVTLSKVCGAITTAADALAAGAEASFTVTNTTVAATDVVVPCIKSGPATAGTYAVTVSAVGAGSFILTLTNLSAGSLSEAVVINFVVIEAVAA